jgi:hypothetical protein
MRRESDCRENYVRVVLNHSLLSVGRKQESLLLQAILGNTELKEMKFTPSQLPATIYGNNEITCGNSYSTL